MYIPYITNEKINQLGLDNSAAEKLPKDTVCLSRTGASIGYTVILGKPMATNQGFVNFICGDVLYPKYLLYLFLLERPSLFEFAQGSAHKTIYFPEAKAFHVCVPPLNEQKNIVEKIERLFLNIQQIETLANYVKKRCILMNIAILKKAFEGKLVPQDPNDEPASVLLERIQKEKIKIRQ